MRIWTAVSTESASGKRHHNIFNSGFDYAEAKKEFKLKFPDHNLEALAPGQVEMKTYDSRITRKDETMIPHPLNGMPAGF
jgi:hypothetical protein